jgi:putative permease
MSRAHHYPVHKRETYLRLAAVIAIILTSLIVLIKVDDLLVSFVLAFVINYTIGPFINWLERKQVPRSLAVVVIFTSSGIIISLGIYLVVPLISDQLQDLMREAPKLQADLVSLIGKLESHFKIFFKSADVNFADAINTWLLNKSTELSSVLPSILSHSFTVVLLAPLMAFFMLQDGRKIGRSLLSLVPNIFFELALNLFHQINEQLGGFIRARFLEAAIVGFVVWVGLLAISFPFATLLAIVAALTNLIPYVGPIIGIVPALAIAFISPAGHIADPIGLNIFLVCLVYFIAQLIDMLIIIPVVVAKIVDLHPALVIIVIIIGAQVMGVLGMMISIPVASVIKVTLTAIYEHLIDFPRVEED